MAITTMHNYLDKYPINQNSTRLIIGTIHPHLTDDFNIDFFYGNIGSFWDILSNSFPERDFNTKDHIIQTLNDYNISITDMIRQCDRENEFITEDSKLYNIIDNVGQIKEGIANSKIDTIYFTSRFGKNNAAKLFVKKFKINYRKTFNPIMSEFTIERDVFGREIKAVVLYSPSNNANIGISKTSPYLNNYEYYQGFKHPVKQFKIEFYKNKFIFFNDQNK